MKVLILANSSKGVYGFRNELMLELLKEYEVVVSVPDEVSVKELSDEGCRIIHTDINRRGVNPVQDMGLFMRYFKLLKKEKPDVVLTYTIKPNIYGGWACRLRKIPYITTITGLGSGFEKSGILKKIIVTMYRVALKKAACIFFQNSENMQIFEDCKIKGRKTRLVQGSGVNLETNFFEEYPEDDGIIKLLYVGRIMKEKGIGELLDAAKYFDENRNFYDKSIEFDLLGYCDDDIKETVEEAEKNGYIRLLGFSPYVHSYLRDCSVVVLPTYHEGMSNVLQESSAVGRPVIATNIPGCREIFDEGITGFGCEPKDSSTLIDAIDRFIKLPYEEKVTMGKNARHKMEFEFNRANVVKAYVDEMKAVL